MASGPLYNFYKVTKILFYLSITKIIIFYICTETGGHSSKLNYFYGKIYGRITLQKQRF